MKLLLAALKCLETAVGRASPFNHKVLYRKAM